MVFVCRDYCFASEDLTGMVYRMFEHDRQNKGQLDGDWPTSIWTDCSNV